MRRPLCAIRAGAEEGGKQRRFRAVNWWHVGMGASLGGLSTPSRGGYERILAKSAHRRHSAMASPSAAISGLAE